MAGRRPKQRPKLNARDTAYIESLPKMSETMLAFGKPLLHLFAPAPTLDELKNLLVLITVAWNLPIYEQRKRPEAAEYRATLNKAIAGMPNQIREIVAALLHSRLTTYGRDPRTGFARAELGVGGEAKVVATAALADDAW